MGGFLGACAPVPRHRIPRIVKRACAPRPTWNSHEEAFVEAVLRAALLGRRYVLRAPLLGGGSTTTESGDPWRHLLQGSRYKLKYWDVEWVHAGRTYRMRVEKLSAAADDWRWSVRTTRYGARDLAGGRDLAGLRHWVVTRSPLPGGVWDALGERDAVALRHLPPTDAPEPVSWPAT